MKKQLLFIDGSADPKSKIGFGAYLMVDQEDLDRNDLRVNTIRFEMTSSSKLELQILIYVLKSLRDSKASIMVYTDSNSIISLQRRKASLIKNDFRSKNNRLLNHHLLYREFYALTEHLNCEFVKLEGHSKSSQKNAIDELFTRVDRVSRKSLRSFLNNN